jgi:hypothetical protein
VSDEKHEYNAENTKIATSVLEVYHQKGRDFISRKYSPIPLNMMAENTH